MEKSGEDKPQRDCGLGRNPGVRVPKRYAALGASATPGVRSRHCLNIRADHAGILALIVFLVGGGIFVLGEFLSVSVLSSLGLMVVAVAPLVVGLHAIVTRKLLLYEHGRGHTSREKYTGFGAIGMGVFFVALGVFIAAISLAEMLGWDTSQVVESKMGLALAGLGAVGMLYGLGQINMSYLYRGRQLAWYHTLQAKIGGALIVMIGAVVTAAGLIYSFSPAMFFKLRLAAFELLLSLLRKL
jgi:hypothetical protein